MPNTILSLFSKISKVCPEAKHVMEKMPEFEKMISHHQDSKSSIKFPLLFDSLPESSSIFSSEFSIIKNSSLARDHVQQKIDEEYLKQRKIYASSLNKCLCIRAAIVERKLLPIVEFLLNNASKYYEEESIIANDIYGNIFYHLLTGPCSLEYSRMKSLDIGWMDPPAKELIDRQRIYSNGSIHSSGTKLMKNIPTLAHFNKMYRQFGYVDKSKNNNNNSSLPDEETQRGPTCTIGDSADPEYSQLLSVSSFGNILSGIFQAKNSSRILLESPSGQDHTGSMFRCHGKSVSQDEQHTMNCLSVNRKQRLSSQLPAETTSIYTAREYIEWLHQNCHTELIYGKNNVLVNTSDGYIRGYLSLHLADVTSSSKFYSAKNSSKNLLLKWTPNLAVHLKESATVTSENDVSQCADDESRNYWRHAFTVNMENVVYIHCHHQNQEVNEPQMENAHLGDSIILIRLDGVQLPPLFFPRSSSASFNQFLMAIEEGLQPNGNLEPPPPSIADYSANFANFPQTKRCNSGTISQTNDDSQQMTEGQQQHSRSNSQPATFADFFSFGRMSQRVPQKEESSNSMIPDHPALIESKTQDSLFRVVHKKSELAEASNGAIKLKQNYFREFYESPKHSYDISSSLSFETNNPGCTSIDDLCSSIRRQILVRTIRGWYEYYRMLKMMRSKLARLINESCASHCELLCLDQPVNASSGVTEANWLAKKRNQGPINDRMEFYRHLYFGGCAPAIRQEVWLTLLGVYPWEPEDMSVVERINNNLHANYEKILTEWMTVEAIITAEANKNDEHHRYNEDTTGSATTGVNETIVSDDVNGLKVNNKEPDVNEFLSDIWTTIKRKVSSARIEDLSQPVETLVSSSDSNGNTLLTQNTFTDNNNMTTADDNNFLSSSGEVLDDQDSEDEEEGQEEEAKLKCKNQRVDSSFSYSREIIDAFSINIQRIDKDVARCDRNYAFYSEQKSKSCLDNLGKLRNIMASWVWQHMDIGYVQGMCDILAPVLVVMNGNEHLSHAAFTRIMRWSIDNFPKVPSNINLNKIQSINSGIVGRHLLQETELEASKPRKLSKRIKHPRGPSTARHEERSDKGLSTDRTSSEDNDEKRSRIDQYLDNLNSLIEFLDPEIHQLMNRSNDNTYFFFCYRWFLLDFKREMQYDDIFKVWETIWSARMLITDNFNLFIALAMILFYRDHILCYNMDFTDIIRFFNERAEHHDADKILFIARNLLFQLQSWINVDANLQRKQSQEQ